MKNTLIGFISAIILVLLIFLISMVAASGIKSTTTNETAIAENDATTNTAQPSIHIMEKDILHKCQFIYDVNTKIVYIENVTYAEMLPKTVLTLYLSENGNPYRYVDGEFIEVID